MPYTSLKAPKFTVRGKSAIITGAGSGINLAFAKLLLSKGCNVLFADIALRPEAQNVVDEYTPTGEAGKPSAIFLPTDVTHWDQLSKMFEVAEKEFGQIDLVCPGAGIYEPHNSNFWHPPGTPLSRDLPDAGRYLTLDINLTHPIRTTQLAISSFLNPKTGDKASIANPKRIIHISSIAAQGAPVFVPIYSATKAGLSSFVRSLGSLEHTNGIRVNAVAPGVIETPLWREHPEKMHMIDESVDVWATPEEVAEAMLSCVESDNMVGGTILEVGHKHTRRIRQYNDPGPSGKGHTATKAHVAQQEVYDWLSQDGWGKPAV
ncbi:NAD(P)-binding protein [Pseudovirgaria hyperparasitica]|uniref:NAD(P)-binding protein n=1 Tax=Pseudovirgaria hyperparasitica TaxID=470096 RepID=A0A6A6WA56_9PEZI|nr:NAD(P)-binding protein [Pseudovirgaria hyperparasitica]KAF2759049.1 NAD(P)-binding protein [Pseudovirgaria hyperparasitica]